VISVATVGTRVAALLLSTSFPGGSAVPAQIKVGLTIALTALLYPLQPNSSATLATSNGVGLIGGELAVGLMLGLSITVIFEAAQMAGQIAGLQMGFSLVNIIDPQTQVETPVLATLHQLLVLLIFLQLNVHVWLLRGMASSFSYLPPGGFHVTESLVATLAQACAAIWLAAVEIAAPILLATILADIALGFIGKASPQLQVLFLGMSAKTLLGLLAWASALWLWPARFESYFGQAIRTSEALLHLAR